MDYIQYNSIGQMRINLCEILRLTLFAQDEVGCGTQTLFGNINCPSFSNNRYGNLAGVGQLLFQARADIV